MAGKHHRTRILPALLLLLAVLMAAAASFNFLALRYYRAAYPPPGRFYRVDGYDMHLYCVGSGSPPIVLESGLGDTFLSWGKVQPKLAELTRVCSYDRAGLGWSAARPGIRDSNAIVAQLHSLLRQAGVSEPFILMGHSVAGLHMRAYMAGYPQEIAGIVFVDPSTPEQFAAFGPEYQAINQKDKAEERKQKWQATIGLTRLRGKCGVIPPGFEAWAGWLKASDSDCNPASYTASERESSAFELSGKEVAQTGPWGNLSILISPATRTCGVRTGASSRKPCGRNGHPRGVHYTKVSNGSPPGAGASSPKAAAIMSRTTAPK